MIKLELRCGSIVKIHPELGCWSIYMPFERYWEPFTITLKEAERFAGPVEEWPKLGSRQRIRMTLEPELDAGICGMIRVGDGYFLFQFVSDVQLIARAILRDAKQRQLGPSR